MNKKKRNTVIAVVAIALVLAASAAAGVNYIGLDNLMAMIGSLSVSESESADTQVPPLHRLHRQIFH